jgi:hypothetical protein
LHWWLQAQGCRVLAAQVNEDEDDEEQKIVSALDLSAARILQLGWNQLLPQEGVLWLDNRPASPMWGQLSPGLVVLDGGMVRMHAAGVMWPYFSSTPSGCIS